MDNNLHFKNLTQSHMFQDTPLNNNHFRKTAISHTIENNELSNVFFSQNNIDVLQEGIRYVVYKNSQHIISRQSEMELKIIMRSTYLQYSHNLPYNILEQVKSLNQKVLDFVVPRIISEIGQYIYYIKDISSQPIPMERSKNVSSAGTKFLYTAEL